MKDTLQDKGTVDTNSYVLNMIMKSDMGKAFPDLANAISRRIENREREKEMMRNE